MTQKESIIQLLNQAEFVCGTIFLQNYLQEYRTRINELRKDGFTIEARRCTKHPHKGIMQEWSLRVKASETSQNAPETTKPSRTTAIPSKTFCCASSQIYKDKKGVPIHALDCTAKPEPQPQPASLFG
jgi:hypothetical protein